MTKLRSGVLFPALSYYRVMKKNACLQVSYNTLTVSSHCNFSLNFNSTNSFSTAKSFEQKIIIRDLPLFSWRGYEKFFSVNFFLIHAPLQTIFFFEIQTVFIHTVFASNLFCFFRPCKQFFFNEQYTVESFAYKFFRPCDKNHDCSFIYTPRSRMCVHSQICFQYFHTPTPTPPKK